MTIDGRVTYDSEENPLDRNSLKAIRVIPPAHADENGRMVVDAPLHAGDVPVGSRQRARARCGRRGRQTVAASRRSTGAGRGEDNARYRQSTAAPPPPPPTREQCRLPTIHKSIVRRKSPFPR